MEGLELGVATEPTPDLRAAVQALTDRVTSAGGRATLSEHKRMVLARRSWEARVPDARPAARSAGETEPDDGECAFGITAVRVATGSLVGYAQVSGGGGRQEYAAELLADPDVDGSAAVAGPLLDGVIDHVAALGGGALRLWVPGATPSDDDLAVGHGFAPERDLIQMRCPLPPPPDPRAASSETGLVTRPFRPGEDEEAWLTVNNRAFAGHPEQGNWDLATLLEREREEWFDPEGFLVLEAGGRMAGSCWTKVHHRTTPPLGEIYVIGVDPDFHGRGWGRALTRAGLEWLAGEGLTTGMLYVDADNVAAVGLYRSMGFTPDHVDRSYLRNVPPR